MGWEDRPGGKYFYKAVRDGSSVRKVYLGNSQVAQLIAERDCLARAQRQANRKEEAAGENPQLKLQVAEFDKVVGAVLHGFRLAKRADDLGRNPRQRKVIPMNSAGHKLTQGQFLALVARADRGSEKALQELRAVFDTHPQIWRASGDLGGLVETQLIELAAKRSSAVRETIQRQIKERRRELSKSGGDPLEKLLVDRVIINTLDVLIDEVRVRESQTERSEKRNQSRLDRSQRRYLESIQALGDYQRDYAVGRFPPRSK